MMRNIALLGSVLLCGPLWTHAADPLTSWSPFPAHWKGASLAEDSVKLSSDPWGYLFAPDTRANAEISASITITEAARQFRFFGESWSVWPSGAFDDNGFEAAVLLRAGEKSGYRIQFSHKLQVLALVKWPEGGFVRVVPCTIQLNQPHKVVASVQDSQVSVRFDGEEKILWRDDFLPLEEGLVGLGASSGAKVLFNEVQVKTPDSVKVPPAVAHQPQFSVRSFLGGRPWVFDGDEPILLLPVPKANAINNVKLRPGYKPQLSWNSHWDVQNQGAYKEADNRNTEPSWSGGGETLTAQWTSDHIKGAFSVNTRMTVGWDPKRKVYTYDVDSFMDVKQDFFFRYGYDFEHHTPLDPFRWQYLIARKKGGEVYHRPVGPVDPGLQHDLETDGGARVWFGRHGETMHIAPAVEYAIKPVESGSLKLATAVCAAFYDTGVFFAQGANKPTKAGTRIAVKYRYTGWPAGEAEALFNASKIYDSPMLDPEHHYIFADEWPKLTFSQFVPMSQTWSRSRRPFMSGHNMRPSYELVKHCGAGSGFAMKLGPSSFGRATLASGGPLAKGRYVVTALVKSVNTHGPGGRIELTTVQSNTNKKLSEEMHFVGNGSFDWTRQGFAFDVPEEGSSLAVAFGNAGTGEFLITDVEFRRLGDGEALPGGVSAAPHTSAPFHAETLPDAIADFRMEEGGGFVVLNYAGGRHLELANVDWVVDSGRSALRFADSGPERRDFRRTGHIGLHVFGYAKDPDYLRVYKTNAGKESVPFAMSQVTETWGNALVLGTDRYDLGRNNYRGLLGRTLVIRRSLSKQEIEGLAKNAVPLSASEKPEAGEMTLAAWIKPADNMVPLQGRGGDILGYGNSTFVLTLQEAPPYRLVARVAQSKALSSERLIEANQWHHVALTVKPENDQITRRLYINGRQVADDTGGK